MRMKSRAKEFVYWLIFSIYLAAGVLASLHFGIKNGIIGYFIGALVGFTGMYTLGSVCFFIIKQISSEGNKKRR